MEETKKQLKLSFVVIDIETTGLSYKQNEIMEIGAIRYEHNEITDEFSKFIKPVEKVPLNIFKLTGIKEDDLKRADKAKTVLSELKDFLYDDDLIVCHNAEFDINFICRSQFFFADYRSQRPRILYARI